MLSLYVICVNVHSRLIPIRANIRRNTSDKLKVRFTCHSCDYLFKTTPGLGQHVTKIHIGQTVLEFTCYLCDKMLMMKTCLEQHKWKKHLGKCKKFKCPIKMKVCSQHIKLLYVKTYIYGLLPSDIQLLKNYVLMRI